MLPEEIANQYESIKKHQRDLQPQEISDEFSNLADACLNLLSHCDIVDLESAVNGKRYFCWRNPADNKKSRPVNRGLFVDIESATNAKNQFFFAVRNNNYGDLTSHDLTIGCYVAAISFCAVIDIYKDRDQKTPGTFFEYLIGHCYARKLGIDPRDRVDVLNLDDQTSLPTDFIFDLGQNQPKLHLPVKTSTRERVIQVWAHQRVLDGVYGVGRFWGTLVALAETKMDYRDNQVTEICLPDQWKLYQMFISQMKRIYYLDLPGKYAELNNSFPKIHVKEFGEFFYEIDSLDDF